MVKIENDEYTIFNADAFEKIDEIKNSSYKYNHIITDPPYNISKDNNFNTLNRPRTGVNFGPWDKDFDLFSWIAPYCSLLDKNGSIIIFCSYRFISFIISVLEEEADMEVKDVLEWKKTNPMPRNINRRYVQDTEFAIWAVKKNGKWIFNKPDDKKYLRSTFETSIVSGKEKIGHPTQKSLKLMNDIISIHTNIGDTIIDPFMGSGTTGLAALNLNRKFIGIEKEKVYFEMAKNRLADPLSDFINNDSNINDEGIFYVN